MTNREAINLLEEVRVLDDSIYAYNKAYSDALEMALTALEAEEAWYESHEYPHKERWIPVTERLPKKPDNYPKCEIRRTYYLVSLESGCVESLGYDFDRDEWMITGSPVAAWMPLPAQWKGKE
jgi:hypothetical protein